MVEKKPAKKNTENPVSAELDAKLEAAVASAEAGNVVSRDVLPRRLKPEPVVEALASEYAVVGTGEKDTVSVAALVYRNVYAKKSLSVHHLQRRLNERGYAEAYSDKDGWLDDGTIRALKAFAQDHDLPYEISIPLISAVFLGDDNVVVAP